jgi:hypothetical protein
LPIAVTVDLHLLDQAHLAGTVDFSKESSHSIQVEDNEVCSTANKYGDD